MRAMLNDKNFTTLWHYIAGILLVGSFENWFNNNRKYNVNNDFILEILKIWRYSHGSKQMHYDIPEVNMMLFWGKGQSQELLLWLG